MFHVGDYIVYGSVGVCRVDHIGTMSITGISKNKLYYTLIPIYTKGSKLFTPTDNEKVKMRPVITNDEALELIDQIAEIDIYVENEDKKREEIFKESLKRCDCRENIKVIKTLYERKQTVLGTGKKVSAVDKKYLQLAEDSLYGEFAISLGIEKDEVEETIKKRVKAKRE